jgi:hypothetical protein
VAAALGFAGCTPDASDRSYGGVPPEATPPPDAPLGEGGPVAALRDGGATIAVTTWGSSSCHATAETAEWDDDTLSLRLGRAGGPACTADMAPHTLEFDVPTELRGRSLTIELTYADWDGTDTLQLG